MISGTLFYLTTILCYISPLLAAREGGPMNGIHTINKPGWSGNRQVSDKIMDLQSVLC